VVAAHRLVEWKAHPANEHAFADDYSSSSFSLKGPDGAVANAQHWSQPIAGAEHPAALAAALAALAKAKVPKPMLFYLVP
jgi:hypothetical protein